jgi:hypothetical protein
LRFADRYLAQLSAEQQQPEQSIPALWDPPDSAQASPTERATSATNAIQSFLIARLLESPGGNSPVRDI